MADSAKGWDCTGRVQGRRSFLTKWPTKMCGKKRVLSPVSWKRQSPRAEVSQDEPRARVSCFGAPSWASKGSKGSDPGVFLRTGWRSKGSSVSVPQMRRRPCSVPNKERSRTVSGVRHLVQVLRSPPSCQSDRRSGVRTPK